MAEAIVARGIRVRRGASLVLDAVDMRADFGAVTCVLGPNGAGKSTLLKAVCGLVPFTGELRVDGADPRALSPRARAQRIAYVPQQTQLRAPLKVRDVVAMGLYARAASLSQAEVRESEELARVLDTSAVAHLAERPFTELSGGEQRRVLLARALATGARVLLLDEPAASLDLAHVLLLFSMCRGLARKGVAVVMVLHQLADVLRFADRVLLLHRGKEVAFGVPDQVLTPERVREVYGVHMIPRAAPSFEREAPAEAQ